MLKKYKLYILEVFLVLLALFLIYFNYFDFLVLLKSLFVLMFILLYKYIAFKVGFNYTYYKYKSYTYYKAYENEKIFKDFFKTLLKRNKWLYYIIFIIFLLLPWMWAKYLIFYICIYIYDIILLLNSNKDIFIKKYFNKYVKVDLSIMHNKYFSLIIFIILNLIRILKDLRYLILEKQTYKELIKVRYIAVIYILLYILIYSDYLYLSILLLIFFCFQIIGKSRKKGFYFKGVGYHNISEYLTQYSNVTLTEYIIMEYLKIMKYEYEYLYIKYLVFFYNKLYKLRLEINYMFQWKQNLEEIYFDKWWRWYERSYGVSLNILYFFYIYSIHRRYNKVISVYNKAKKIFKDDLEPIYYEYYIKEEKIYKAGLMLLMDVRRLSGYPREKWMLSPKEDSIVHNDMDYGKKYEYLKEELDKYVSKENIPNNFVFSNKLYNKIYFYCNLLYKTNIFGSNKIVEELLEKKIARCYGYNYKFHDWSIIHDFYWDIWWPEQEDNVPYIELHSSKLQEEICKEVEKFYIERYENMKDKWELVSEKFIKEELIEKYLK